eukprot:CAMPEP_0197827074 /NCGR_PEP_ID=MMETSP1437-20131217/3941_1 /TAXON_ID=49252 ORGANISM="Eucampia antarctica, Strain CCMP1452" /NCGR_SAMPLE_ID=MMETSP1437 /ASSEMBLY_ACC=CAM_ASM_001096 /LENGTH=203 /DNA_ID=CAMNT_0043427791 /DNA_START=76 /DNA_END=687 /DNA_ORIENTATION=+
MADAEYVQLSLNDQCPTMAPFFGFMGCAASIILANVGAAYGTARSGEGILVCGISSPELIWRNLIPVIMAGVNGIYGLITAIVLMGAIKKPVQDGQNIKNVYSLYTGFAHLAAGLCCGLCGLASGMAIGIAGGSAVRSCGIFDVMSRRTRNIFGGRERRKKKAAGSENLFVAMVLIQVFAGNLALYGLITSVILTQATYECPQ